MKTFIPVTVFVAFVIGAACGSQLQRHDETELRETLAHEQEKHEQVCAALKAALAREQAMLDSAAELNSHASEPVPLIKGTDQPQEH
jgi:hypothetical protein